ncbi:peptide ABC transporter substrate-binding protein [Sphaerisporangium siamense]|uniref:Peptide/nickel transport system substrate-binding protein n=1 Tax=Sphaerisporangium siamense TaxID=795645 RepID=A0A7W7G9T4_9ACTN|nr:ABC transporter substrate-binding protein [Sphaerisporangium siamense]MBB4700975.1 peptide/nickel transport system substrate-binding protein [Sphaerisporangium siamense]GII85879.1 peptide ABC transporter substrate-binding protein [Sphaerisporangium siamense]
MRLRGPILALAVCVLLASCSTAGASGSGGGAPRAGGTLTFTTDIEPDVFDPHVSPADITGVIMRNVLDSLVAEDRDGSFKPWLATSWKISPDGRSYTFRLREDVTFTDGTPFDAAAVKANLDRVVAPATKSQYAAVLIAPYERADVEDPHTVTVRLKRPYAPFLHALSTTYLGIYSPKALREHAADLAAGGPRNVGSGPFLLASRVKGQQAVFTRNPAYNWAPGTARHRGPAYLDKLVIGFLPENATRVGAVGSGQSDVADFLPAGQVRSLTARPGLRVLSQESPGLVYSYYLNTERPPFDRREARLAVRAAIDTALITKAVFAGQYRPAWSPLSPSTPAYDATLENTWPYRPGEADRLLDGLGWTGRDADGYRTKDGKRFAITLLYVPAYTKAERRTYDTAVQDALRKVGVQLTLKPLDAATYTPVRNRGEYDIIAYAWGGSEPDLLRAVFHSGSRLADGGANGARVHDSEVDAWLDQAATTTDRAARADLYAKVQRKVVAEAYSVPAFVASRQLAVRERARDVGFDASAWPLFHDAWVTGR